MDIQKNDPSIIVLSTRLYRLLLLTYPKSFRREYTPHMAQVFRDCCLNALHTRGFPGMLSLWSLTLIDYITSAFNEHTRKGVHMNTARFTRLSGWALVLSGLAILIGGLATQLHSGQYPYNPYNYYSRSLDPILEVLSNYLLPSAFLLVSLGLLGLYQRYSSGTGSLGRGGLEVSIVSGALGTVVLLVGFVVEVPILWYLLLLSTFLLFGGISIFGIDAVRHKTLPRWNYLPVLTGIWMPIWILAAQIIEALTGSELYIPAIDIPIFLITSFGLVGIGYLLQSDAPAEEQLIPR